MLKVWFVGHALWLARNSFRGALRVEWYGNDFARDVSSCRTLTSHSFRRVNVVSLQEKIIFYLLGFLAGTSWPLIVLVHLFRMLREDHARGEPQPIPISSHHMCEVQQLQ